MEMVLNNINNPTVIAIIALSIAVIALLCWVISMHLKLRKFLIGIDSKHIGDSLDTVTGELSNLKVFRSELEKYLDGVEKRLRKSVKSVHTVRFNPWHGSGEGGNQSFATAFMNEDGDGVLISSLYSRDHVSVFGKPLKGYASLHELSDEERKAVEEAKNNL
ncbi:MAG: DUF4446 family protein [Candidatus Taylorbacteria bacterium]|nr:DUF4446 family protein [Candidatus Taylorbacteria bacterium]